MSFGAHSLTNEGAIKENFSTMYQFLEEMVYFWIAIDFQSKCIAGSNPFTHSSQQGVRVFDHYGFA